MRYAASLLTAFALLCLASAPAYAARTELAPIAGFSSPVFGLTVDSTDNLWVGVGVGFGEEGTRTIYKFDPYPSTTKLAEQDGGGHFSCIEEGGTKEIKGRLFGVSVASPSNTLYVYEVCEGPHLTIFDGSGLFKEKWTLVPPGYGSSHNLVAVDNSDGPGRGRVYLLNIETLRAFEPSQAKANFSAIAPYLKGNQIIGAPLPNLVTGAPELRWQQSFAQIEGLALDHSGNIYISLPYQNQVFEYAPSGEFVQSFVVGPASGSVQQSRAEAVAVDPTTDNVLIAAGSSILEFSQGGQLLETFQRPTDQNNGVEGIAINSDGVVYYFNYGRSEVHILSAQPRITPEPFSNPTPTSGTLNATVDAGGAEVAECFFEYGTDTSYGSQEECEGTPPPFTAPTQVQLDLGGLTTETTYHYRVVIATGAGLTKGPDQTYTPHHVLGLTTDPAGELSGTGATLKGSYLGNGEDTHYYFQWGDSTAYGHFTALPPGLDAGSPGGPARTALSALINGLEPLATYHYRVVAKNGAGTSHGEDRTLTTTTSSPLVGGFASGVHSESVLLNARINPGGEPTAYDLEYGPEPCAPPLGSCTKLVSAADLGRNPSFAVSSTELGALAPGTTYHYRILATNDLGTTSFEGIFDTFPFFAKISDPCPNALARQQTGAALLLDCRAYELVSARDAGGYDVESDLVPGQAPFPGYPGAEDPPRVLYGVHNGGIPATGHPTNKGVDPYLATRGQDGWSTAYVGVPADNPFATAPFSSVPSGADAGLASFAFGGPGGCSPCFAGGYTGIPVRLPDGSLVQGMIADPGLPDPGPAATPDGYIARPLSADGTHLIFGSTSLFAPGGNDETGDVSIYDRDLQSGETHVVSNDPAGEDFPAPLPCLQGAGNCHSPANPNGISELDLSADGSRILIGQKVGTDAQGNVHYHLYMVIDDAVRSIDLTPGATSGVLFAGMSADGSAVYFTAADQLPGGDDHDSSADLYRAQLTGAGALTLTRLSTGTEGAGDTDACETAFGQGGPEQRWNTGAALLDCSVLAIGGGGGVAADDGSVYFLSPELLEGAANGSAGEPNLYLARPGSGPQFVATLGPDDALVRDSLADAELRRTADFQISSDGSFAAFPSRLSLTGYQNAGHTEVYRYGPAAGLDCASCNPSNGLATSDASLASNGLSLSEHGQVFFNTTDPLSLRDTGNVKDAYEWEPQGSGDCTPASLSFNARLSACTSLISSGSSPFDSSLLGIGASGTDAYFFTHDSLEPQDANGPIIKIYDARSEGGFFQIPAPPPCAASDECHGPGSQAPGLPEIRTVAPVPQGNAPSCRPRFVLRHGRCVKRKKPTHRKARHAHRHRRPGR